ncbi:glycosyltransferase [Dyadobacter arcticus]|uniref:Sterol 3beta-glucosyltransferase n=1 Tax=Dyadobacter arcticus TaxID=1078754 RepID=A0ABX0UT34_9BACT|nr:glycosyltransferase [Dyadobacter arcticus]NIJ56132.1 sterol 3beta-glucosyltransferase [Dyadobacter arcticus]
MKIALLTLGTRGDVQPYAVLGEALQRRGHQVVLSTARNFESLARSYKLDFVPVDADFQALLDSEEGKQMMRNPILAQRNFGRWVHPMIQSALDTFYKVSLQSDKILFHGKTLAGFFADQFPNKMIRANVIPAFEPTAEFVNPVLSGVGLPSMLNKFSYKLTEFSYRMMHKPVLKFRQENGLSSLTEDYKELPSIYGVSHHLLKEPGDYPANSHFTGFWYGESPATLSPDVMKFLQEGSPPLLVTFGSMPLATKLNMQQAMIQLAEKLNTRIIIVKGWGFENTGDLKEYKSIKIIESAPYEKLLPRVKAVIHHGGIGTMAECLRAGKPFLTCPVLYPMGDQHFWGQLAFQKGCALKPIPLKKLTQDQLITAGYELLTKPNLYNNSRRMADLLHTENGIDNAIELIEKPILST